MTPEYLRELYGNISPRAAAKTIDHIDIHCKKFIEHSPFCILATSDGKNLDVSPKGDPVSFVHVADSNTLIIPDRPGNNRIDGLLNIIAHPFIALLFIIPTVNETLRVNGSAEIIDDMDICLAHAINGRTPLTVTRITVSEAFLHCGKAPLRGALWDSEKWPNKRPIPNLYEIIKDHAKGLNVPQKTNAEIEKQDIDTLY
ncbi:MAG: pyridoxamine 5'-phosphate oxidase family protein [Proteobacteria bacterium]|jgi:PPOX class probable FMN-dependent enzyme|nr:pyridoxamine 5'-phosphate oxidase family protein [Pseudomonadota bacterium]